MFARFVPFLPSPTTALVSLVAALACAAAGFAGGYRWHAGAVALDRQDDLERSILDSNKQRRADLDEAITAFKAGQDSLAAAAARRSKLEADLARRPLPAQCDLDHISLGLLVDSVRAANARATTSAGLHGGVPTNK